jgi:hypothetical protein
VRIYDPDILLRIPGFLSGRMMSSTFEEEVGRRVSVSVKNGRHHNRFEGFVG